MTRPRYTAETDGLKTKAIVEHRDDRTDRTIVTGLPVADAEQLARDWNKYEPPDPAVCVHDDGTQHVKQVTA